MTAKREIDSSALGMCRSRPAVENVNEDGGLAAGARRERFA